MVMASISLIIGRERQHSCPNVASIFFLFFLQVCAEILVDILNFFATKVRLPLSNGLKKNL